MSRQPDATSVASLFETVAGRFPTNPAVIRGDETVSYAELDRRADALAGHLANRGVEQGDLVGLFLPRTADLIVSMLAVLKIGAAYVPLDRKSPGARNKRLLERAGARAVVSDGQVGGLLEGLDHVAHVVASGITDGGEGTPRNRRDSPDDVAYVMYTSGSTGEPKGVVVPHRAIIRLVRDTNYVELTPRDRILQLSSPSFDASTFEIWGALLNGGATILLPSDEFDPNLLKRAICENGVTIAFMTTALFNLIVNRFFESIRPLPTVITGGDVISPNNVRKVLESAPEMNLIHAYGPTENTTFTCCHRIEPSDLNGGTIPIGPPISGTDVYVLDESQRPVSDGEVGELYVGGLGVALGYLNDDSDNGPFQRLEHISSDLVYRTGDLVKRNSAGAIEFVGRADNQVKIRGYRVSLEEICDALVRVPGVLDASPFVEKHESGDQLLVAYVLVEDETCITAGDIRKRLRSDVPDYMVPNRFIIKADFPINKNGKIDKKMLRAR